MPKIVFQMIVFNCDYVLEECLRSILPFGNVVVSEGPVSYWQSKGYTTSTDDTNKILAKLIPAENVIHGQWPEKDDESNATVHLIPEDTDFVWTVGSDEIWKREDIQKVVSLLDNYDLVSFKANSFYGGFDRIMTGFEENFEVHRVQRWYPGARWASHRPPTVNPIGGRPWRILNHESTDAMGIRMFHYSYVFPRQMKEKNDYYDAIWPGVMIPDYFNQVYIPWVTGDWQSVEEKYQGVHNFYPERRGPAFTKRFEGEHPYWIERNMGALKEKFRLQLKETL